MSTSIGPPSIGSDERAAIALALGKARKRRAPDVVSIDIPPGYTAIIAFEQKEFGLCRHLVVKVHHKPRRKRLPRPMAAVDIAHAFGFRKDTILAQWADNTPGEEGLHFLDADEPMVTSDAGNA